MIVTDCMDMDSSCAPEVIIGTSIGTAVGSSIGFGVFGSIFGLSSIRNIAMGMCTPLTLSGCIIGFSMGGGVAADRIKANAANK